MKFLFTILAISSLSLMAQTQVKIGAGVGADEIKETQVQVGDDVFQVVNSCAQFQLITDKLKYTQLRAYISGRAGVNFKKGLEEEQAAQVSDFFGDLRAQINILGNPNRRFTLLAGIGWGNTGDTFSVPVTLCINDLLDTYDNDNLSAEILFDFGLQGQTGFQFMVHYTLPKK